MKTITFLLLVLVLPQLGNAQYKMIEMNPPKAKAPLKRQLDRMSQVQKYKFKGVIGETDQATIAIHDAKNLSKKEHDEVKKMVDAENKDRTSIFQAIIDFNKLNKKEREILVKSAFDTYKGIDAKGTFYYENKTWQKKY